MMRAAHDAGPAAGPPHHRHRGAEGLGQGPHARHAPGREPVSSPICRCRRASAPISGPTAFRTCSTAASWWTRASSSISTIRSPAFRSTAPRSISIGTRRARRWSMPFQVRVGRQPHHPARAVRRAARRQQRRGASRSPAARSCWPPPRRRDPKPLVLNRIALRHADRSRQAAHRPRAGRTRQRRSRRRALRQPRLFRATIRGWRSALPARACRSRR